MEFVYRVKRLLNSFGCFCCVTYVQQCDYKASSEGIHLGIMGIIDCSLPANTLPMQHYSIKYCNDGYLDETATAHLQLCTEENLHRCSKDSQQAHRCVPFHPPPSGGASSLIKRNYSCSLAKHQVLVAALMTCSVYTVCLWQGFSATRPAVWTEAMTSTQETKRTTRKKNTMCEFLLLLDAYCIIK